MLWQQGSHSLEGKDHASQHMVSFQYESTNSLLLSGAGTGSADLSWGEGLRLRRGRDSGHTPDPPNADPNGQFSE